jgi:23S rRNA (cytidine1920-2'-O)/16S rRNA (cytidine1409-2'-O)-methyltransferase
MKVLSAQNYVSRGGIKLAAALDAFGLDCTSVVSADLGSHQGGFVDCLLQRGAGRVHAVDTCYGTLAWKLRRDPRVIVHERCNALHVRLPEPVDLLTIDVGWTRQRLILPAARSMLAAGGRIVTLIKPHYEADPHLLVNGVLAAERLAEVVDGVLAEVRGLGLDLCGRCESPICGHGGNREVFALLAPQSAC